MDKVLWLDNYIGSDSLVMLVHLSAEVALELLNSLLEIQPFLFQVIVLGLQLLDIGVRWGSKVLFNELDGVAGLLWLFIKSDQYFG